MKIVNRQPVETADASSHRGKMWSEFRRLVAYAAALVLVVYFAIGWTVDLIVPRIPPEREAALFSAWAPGDATSPAATNRLAAAQGILNRLAADPAVPPLPYRLALVEDEHPNAFAFPGGTIGLTTGLLDALDHANALTFVIAHELGHFHQRDHLRGLGRALGRGVAFALIFGGEMGNPQLATTSSFVLDRSYSRAQEEGADLFGIRLVHRVYGDTAGCDQLFRQLMKDDAPPAWTYMLATHPAPADRIARLAEEAERLGARK